MHWVICVEAGLNAAGSSANMNYPCVSISLTLDLSLPACSCQLHWPPVFMYLSLFFHCILSSLSSFCPRHVLTSSYLPLFPSVLLSMSLFGTSDPLLVVLPLFFLVYSLTFSCINNVTLSSIPYSPAFPQCPLPPPLTTSSSPTCLDLASRGPLHSQSAYLSCLSLSLSLVELDLLPLLPLCLCNVP